ncbi:hypothetical protein LB507_005058 [Fusarium sp. FIESC RH6]|nr:hypothetical protein LB507_005058 [Fusarium sp. FIESC RH6]
MLPPTLVSVYREYKKDTNSIASWLASTAKEGGYPAHLLPSTPVSVTKEQTVDFVPLAESISNYNKPALSIPQAFFSTLNRVISVRNGFSEQLFRHNEKPDVKSDARHSYFVGILEKVREILKPFSDSATATSTDTVDQLANQFDALKVYEPSEDFINAPDIQRPETTENEQVIFEVDPSESFDEALIAFCMMCEDLAVVRKYISNLCLELINPDNGGPKRDPGVLAVVTNTAVEFGRNIAEDAMPAF